MSDRPEERLDRRDFMIASMATAGASAALGVTAGAASAQGAATASADAASGTVYTGDTIGGKKVVSALNVNDLQAGRDVGIPAFTPEIGAARILNLEMISLFVEGTMNVLKQQGILAGPLGRTGKDVKVFIGNSALPILANNGGLVDHLVKLNGKVEPGQKIAIQRNSFGETVAEYTSSVAGEITSQRSDAMADPGNPLAFFLFHKPPPEGGETYPE